MAEKCFPTLQELRGFGVDGDIWRKFINGEIDEVNLNRNGVDVETLLTWKERVMEMAQQAANLQTYLTKSDANAAQPQPKGTTAQVTNDPDPANNGYWVSDGSQWVWSGVQSASRSSVDEIERNTSVRDSQMYINIASASKSASGYYANLGQQRIIANASTAMTMIPVVPGHRYRVRAVSVNGEVGNKATLVGLVLADSQIYPRGAIAGTDWLEGDGVDDYYVDIPDISQARFLALNTQVAGRDYTGRVEVYDISHDVIDAGSASVKFLGAAGVSDFRSDPVNYAEAGIFLGGKYVSLSSSSPNYGKLLTAAGTGAVMFPVTPGESYQVTASSFPSNLFAIAFKPNANARSADTVRSPGIYTGSGASRQFTVPDDESIRFAIVNAVNDVESWDIRPGLVIESITDSVSFFGGKKLADAVYAQESVLTFPARARGKLWVAVGDSITEKNFRTNKNYHDYIAEAFSGLVVENRGISGSGFYDRYSVADVITSTPDLITVFLGTNDWGGVREASSMPLGVFGDVGTETVAGCINQLLTSLVAKFPGVPIGVATPLPRLTSWGDPGAVNSRGYTLHQLSMLIIRYARHLSLPVIDLYSTSGLPVYDPAGNALFFTAPGQTEPDGLHPNDAGHRVIARKFAALLSDM
ncbi:SGNH/GDSL hydrolase family protein [Alcaligenes faecalis]|uniref:SGNH hydrolase-type esterase domain-containing protein n=1 Tax=Alcaligenes faecalis TaxID=511 RepID=A0AB33CRQ8_ALCFA|nr:SGNH/GDSL hydrolase family protein [Alcaligenes faecalis]ASR89208.1 hypothetical protein AFA_06975 [Alcaligenes faecalis]